jgi:pimeloyl-ACP methyl ester carboxylesterase
MKIELIVRKSPTNHSRVPILCIHGGYHGAWCWDEYFLPYFAEHGHDAYALSLRGHGKSDGHANINRWRIADYVADVEGVAAQISPHPVLIGHSLGGIVAQKYLESHAAPAGVLLASSPLRGMAAASFQTMLRHPLPILKTFLTANMLHSRPTFESVFFKPTMPREKVQAYFARMGNESFRAFMDIVMFDKPRPERVTTPMLVMGGEFDPSIAPTLNEDLARAYHTQLKTLPVAHDMMLDENWELVAQQIVGWLQEK